MKRFLFVLAATFGFHLFANTDLALLKQQAMALTHCQKLKEAASEKVTKQASEQKVAAPQLTSARLQKGKMVVQGSLESMRNSFFIIQFFTSRNDAAASIDATFVGQKTVKSDST